MFNGKSADQFVTLCLIRLQLFENSSKMEDKHNDNNNDQRKVTKLKIETFKNNDEASFQPLVPKKYRKNRKKTKTNNTADNTKIGNFSSTSHLETVYGIIHLYKEDLLSEVSNSKILCMLGIPATVPCNDLLAFTAPCHEMISHIRVLRETLPNQYMALLTFRNHKYAMEFYEAFNGTEFSSLEPENKCRAIWVSNIEVSPTNKPPSNHTELPICAVCLERMDESVDGVLTILCNHTFHTECLVKWADLTCPICRCAQSPEVIETSECMVCGRKPMENDLLWICLICGHIGCNRYIGGHAADHYKKSGHCYALQLGSDRVWDYKGDNFVHRLIQNKSDGKLVPSTAPRGDEEEVDEEKMFAVQLEFSHLMTTQLEAQRKYFQVVITDLENSLKMKDATISNLNKSNKSLESRLNTLSKEKSNLDKKVSQLNSKFNATLTELNEEKLLGQALRQNQTDWQKKFKETQDEFGRIKKNNDDEIANLKEQLRDIMFYIEAQRTIESMENSEEIKSGRVEIRPTPPPQQPGPSKSRRRKR